MDKPLLVMIALLLAGCSPAPTEADRAELIGIWNAEDGSGRTIQFKAEGIFDYRYEPGTTLRLEWKLTTKSTVKLVSGNGVIKTCSYKIAGTNLDIDNGSDKACAEPGVTPPSPMPTRFARAG